MYMTYMCAWHMCDCVVCMHNGYMNAIRSVHIWGGGVLYVCYVGWGECGDAVEGVRHVCVCGCGGTHVLRLNQENRCLPESFSTFLP